MKSLTVEAAAVLGGGIESLAFLSTKFSH